MSEEKPKLIYLYLSSLGNFLDLSPVIMTKQINLMTTKKDTHGCQDLNILLMKILKLNVI